jgi:hypothetical protein
VTAQHGVGPGPRVYLHVGEPKTGTTFIQQVMWTNKAELLAAGLLLPGPRPMAHWRAAQDLREVPQIPNDPVGPNKGAWDKLVRQVLRAPQVGVISHELFAAADQHQAERAVRSLEGAEVHVVLSVRDLASLLPAEWQETVKHRNTREWHDWLADVIDVESIAADRREFWFWRVHDTIKVLRTWSTLLPPERVHVITMPPRGSAPDLLWERFAGLVGIDPAVADTERARSNASLGLSEVELLRRINAAMPAELPGWFYMRNVKDALAHGALAARPSTLGRLELPPEREKWAREHAETVVAELRASGYDIVGDLDELLPRPATGAVARPEDAKPEEMLDSAVAAISALLGELAKTQGIQHGTADTAPAARPVKTGRVKARLVKLSQQHPALHRLRRGYWHLANAARQLRSATRPGPSRGGD